MTQRSTGVRRRIVRPVLGTVVILAIAGLTAACAPATPGASASPGASATSGASGAPPTPAPSAAAGNPATPGVLALVAPAAGAVVKQNDPSLASRCPASATHGLGYVIDFSWTVPAGLAHLAGFQVVLQHGSSTPIVLDLDGSTTGSFTELACNTFVIDNNLTAWHWRVNAVDNGKKVLLSSEQRAFTFGPCRLSNGTPCNANV